MENRIIIEVVNNVKVQASPGETPKQNLSNANINKKVTSSSQSIQNNNNTGGGSSKQPAGKFDSILSAEFIAGTLRKFGNATGNEETRAITSAVGKMVKYGTAIVSAMSGNPMGLIAAGIELAAEGFENFCNEKRKKAEEQNNVDMSRINAVLMDVSGLKVSENFWGRVKYEGKNQ